MDYPVPGYLSLFLYSFIIISILYSLFF
uniref:Uncharacterized protein n=1 Tax=Heterorhabditis bacteriophora TaxID=37862 RepID=A0A1I7WAP7_HETBA